MGIDVQRVGNDPNHPSVNSTDASSSSSTASQPASSPTDQGRDSKIGEHSLSADLVRARVGLTSPKQDPTTSNSPQTFNAEDKVPRNVYPGEGKNSPDATPQEAANFIRGLEFASLGDTQQAQAQFFTQALRDHQNQPEWTQQFFRSLGSAKTAEFIQNSLTPGTYQYSSKENLDKSTGVIRNALTGLASRPDLFNQQDMNMLVGKMSDKGFNPWVASELFGKMSWQNDAVKNMFVTAAINKSQDGKTSGRAVSDLAAAAANVLDSTSMDNQAVQLNELRKDGKLANFIQSAMAGPTQMPSLWSVVQSGQRMMPVEMENYSHVDGLLLNASLVDVRDSFDRGLPIPSSDLTQLRTEMFNAAAQALTDGRIQDAYKDSSLFKDGMSRIFENQFDSIMNSGLGSNGAGLDILKFQPGLEKFFQTVLFSQHPDYSAKGLSNFLANKMSAYGQGLMDNSPGAEQRFQAQFGRSRMDAAAVSGGLLGTLTNALKASKDELAKDAEAKAGAVKFVLDVAFGFIPGVGGKLAEGVENSVAKKLIEKTLGPVQDKILGLIKDGAVDKAKQLLLDQYKNKDPELALLGLFNALNQTIPNGDGPGEPNFLAQFQSSYNTAINSPYKITR